MDGRQFAAGRAEGDSKTPTRIIIWLKNKTVRMDAKAMVGWRPFHRSPFGASFPFEQSPKRSQRAQVRYRL